MPWYYHPESECYFRDDEPDEMTAMMCVEVDEAQVPDRWKQADEYYNRNYAKGMNMAATSRSSNANHWQCIHGVTHAAKQPCDCHPAIEGMAVRVAVGDEDNPIDVGQVAGSPYAEAALPDDRLVRVYRKIRDAKKAYVDQVEKYVAETFEQPLKQISTELLRRCQERGNKGFTTPDGTVYLAEDMKVSCGDWHVFYEWMKQNDALDFLEQRVKAGEVKKYMDENGGLLPPGLSVFREFQARVRKPKSSKAPGTPDED